MIDMISYIGDENFCGKNVHERRVRPTLIWPLGDGVLAGGGLWWMLLGSGGYWWGTGVVLGRARVTNLASAPNSHQPTLLAKVGNYYWQKPLPT